MANRWPTEIILHTRQYYPALRKAWRCICTLLFLGSLSRVLESSVDSNGYPAFQKPEVPDRSSMQTQGLCWDRADKPCWTQTDLVQADITVVNYLVCLDIFGLLFLLLIRESQITAWIIILCFWSVPQHRLLSLSSRLGLVWYNHMVLDLRLNKRFQG